MVIKKTDLETIVRVERGTTIDQLLKDLKVKEEKLCIFINDNFYRTLKLDHFLQRGDLVKITPELSGGRGGGVKIATTLIGIGAIVASGGIGGGALVGTKLAVARAGILIGAQFLIFGIQRIFGQRRQDDSIEASNTPNYGLDAGSNRARVLEPLPIVMGEFRINPDISSKPYNEGLDSENVVYGVFGGSGVGAWTDSSSTTDYTNFLGTGSVTVGGQDFQFEHRVATGTPDIWDRRLPSLSAPYRSTLEEAQQVPMASDGDRVNLTYVWITASFINPIAAREKYVAWGDLLANGVGATFLDPTSGTELDVPESFLFDDDFFTAYPKITKGLKQIFNYGYGDLSIDQHRIGNTVASEYIEYNGYFNTETTTNFPLAQVQPNLLGTSHANPAWTTQVNGNVYTVDGGELVGTDNPSANDNWIYRESPDNVFCIQVDVSGTLLRRNPNVQPTGAELLQRQFDFEWSDDGSTWNTFDQAVHNLSLDGTLSLATFSEKYENTYWQNNLTPAKYFVRCRKRDPDETDINNICQMFVDQIRFYKSDSSQLYECQNRIGVSIEASAQLNGTLDTFSSRVRARCWAYDGVSGYTWSFSQNPADWFLYFARGGFKNTSADGSFVYPFSPTTGWVNSADHPDNGEKLFGAGISDADIDFDAIEEWWEYCDTNNLTFNGVLTTRKNAKDVLEEIARAGRGSPNHTLGKLAVIWEEPTQPVVAVFTPDNILKDSFEISYINQKVPDKIICEFIDRSQDYAQNQVEADMPTVSNIVDIANVQLWGTVFEDEAQRTCNLLVSRNLYNKRLITFRTDAEGLIVSRGDVISISHDMTQWGYSGRIKSMTLFGGVITAIEVDVEVDPLITEINVRTPFNEINQYNVTVSGYWINIDGATPWAEADAPRYLNPQGLENPASAYPNSWHDDFIFLAGFSDNGGKTCRIKEINPINTNEVEIVAIDEELAYYAREFGGAYVPPPDYELIKSQVFNPGVEFIDVNTQRVWFEKDGCDAVSVMVQVNGGGYNPFISPTGATIFSNFVDFSYSTNDFVEVIISPVVVGVSSDIIHANISFMVP